MGLLRSAAPEHRSSARPAATRGANANAFCVREALGNLMSNAVKRGTKSGGVSVPVQGNPAEVCIVLKNGGYDPALELPMIFDLCTDGPGRRPMSKPPKSGLVPSPGRSRESMTGIQLERVMAIRLRLRSDY